MNHRSHALYLLFAVVPACHNTPEGPPPDAISPPEVRSYATLQTSEQLIAAITTDLKRDRDRESYDELQEFMKSNVAAGRAMHAHLVFEGARPVFLFQHNDGQRYIAAVTECGRLLEGEAQRELDGVRGAYRAGDMDAIRRAVGGDRSVLSRVNVERSPKLLPYAQFFEGALLYDDARRDGARDAARTERVVALMEQSGAAFRRSADHESYFLTLIVAGQALEDSGAQDLAVEKWLLAADCAYWPRADIDVQKAVGGRIASYRSRLERTMQEEFARKLEDSTAKLRADFDARLSQSLAASEAQHAAAVRDLQSGFEARFEVAMENADERRKSELGELRSDFDRRTLELRTGLATEHAQAIRRVDDSWRAFSQTGMTNLIELAQTLASPDTDATRLDAGGSSTSNPPPVAEPPPHTTETSLVVPAWWTLLVDVFDVTTNIVTLCQRRDRRS